MNLRSESLSAQSEGSGPLDPREALRGALERVSEALQDPHATRAMLLVALSDLWVAEAGLEELLRETHREDPIQTLD